MFCYSGPYSYYLFITKQLKMEGFIVGRWVNEWGTFVKEAKEWIDQVGMPVVTYHLTHSIIVCFLTIIIIYYESRIPVCSKTVQCNIN